MPRRRRRAARERRLEAPHGPVTVRDLSAGDGARVLELTMPGGERVRVAQRLTGWVCVAEGVAPGLPLGSVAEAVEAFTGRARADEPWISVLEEFATGLGLTPGEGITPEQRERLHGWREERPELYWDGPRAQHGGGWYFFIGGLPDGAWVMEYGAHAEEAVAGALTRAGRALED
jgi:hypothetical protein